ncbi:MAG: NAD(P)H-binding protein [Pyrinomonadaceae bacterium]|nr:NAD(P)H-binding protein [Pyrinomonadaceae bacterium]
MEKDSSSDDLGAARKIIVIGATGSLAASVIEASKSLKDTELTLFVRDKRRLSDPLADGCKVVEGDALKYENIKGAIAGHDVVYVNLAGDLETMGNNIVKAMKETGVKRIVAISSIGIYETSLRPVLKPYRKLADIIEASGLDYTILRPDWFTNSDEVDYALTRKGEPETGSAISRKSIAAFIRTIFENPDLHRNENLGISKP